MKRFILSTSEFGLNWLLNWVIRVQCENLFSLRLDYFDVEDRTAYEFISLGRTYVILLLVETVTNLRLNLRISHSTYSYISDLHRGIEKRCVNLNTRVMSVETPFSRMKRKKTNFQSGHSQ